MLLPAALGRDMRVDGWLAAWPPGVLRGPGRQTGLAGIGLGADGLKFFTSGTALAAIQGLRLGLRRWETYRVHTSVNAARMSACATMAPIGTWASLTRTAAPSAD